MRRNRRRVLAIALAPLLAIAARVTRADEPEDFSGDPMLVKRSFVGRVLENANFEGVVATEADFSRARLAGANFHAANLSRAKLWDADLSGADLSLAKFEYTQVQRTDFSRGKLKGVDLGSTYLMEARFRDADLRGLVGLGSCAAVDFRGADLRGANLMGFKEQSATPSKWRGAKYDRATKWPQGFDPSAVEAVLYDGDKPKKPQDTGDRKGAPIPEGRDFRTQDLSKRKFADLDLSHASLWNVDCVEAVFERVRLVGADLSGTDLTGARFGNCDLSGADLRRARIAWPVFDGTDLSKADLRGVDLTQAHLRGCRFVDADLRDLKGLGSVTSGVFAGADLRGANLSGFRDAAVPPFTGFKGALFDKWTRWPADFDPVAAGAVLVPEAK